MSWSVSAIGKPSKVAEKLKAEFEKLNLAKPENEIAAAVGQALVKAAEDSVGVAIKVVASGSMGSYDGNHTHSINVSVEPLHGFVE